MVLAAAAGASPRASDEVPVYGYEVVRSYPHDAGAFTQGLVYHNGWLYEGTGLYGGSSVRQVRLETGEVERIRDLPPHYFGEGIAVVENRLIQLTWLSGVGFVYDLDTFEPLREFTYPTEGWGLSYDGVRLAMSDGSDRVYFLDPTTLERTGSIEVRADGVPVRRLNELEFVGGELFANVWQTDRIARIDPADGRVTGWIGLAGLLPPDRRGPGTDVLNGIAFDPETGRLFVTGKRWPLLFEIRLTGPAGGETGVGEWSRAGGMD